MFPFSDTFLMTLHAERLRQLEQDALVRQARSLRRRPSWWRRAQMLARSPLTRGRFAFAGRPVRPIAT